MNSKHKKLVALYFSVLCLTGAKNNKVTENQKNAKATQNFERLHKYLRQDTCVHDLECLPPEQNSEIQCHKKQYFMIKNAVKLMKRRDKKVQEHKETEVILFSDGK